MEGLKIERIFDAPVERVWDAWAKAASVKKWWGPKMFTAPFVEIDFRVGGKYLNCMRGPGPNGSVNDYWSTGIYKEIKPLKKIVASDSFSDEKGNPVSPSYYGMKGDFPIEFTITVTFESVNGKTKMVLHHIGPPKEELELAKQGWNESFDKLEKSLKGTQKVVPCLWFNGNAEEAVKFYASIFKDSKIGNISRYDSESAKASGMKEGTVMTVDFEIEGTGFLALNGGPEFKFTPAVSFIINCETQEEVDHLWKGLTKDGGKPVQCGWLEDRFGVSWQIVPTRLNELLLDSDPVKSQKVMKAMLGMKKLDIAKLEKAYSG